MFLDKIGNALKSFVPPPPPPPPPKPKVDQSSTYHPPRPRPQSLLEGLEKGNPALKLQGKTFPSSSLAAVGPIAGSVQAEAKEDKGWLENAFDDTVDAARDSFNDTVDTVDDIVNNPGGAAKVIGGGILAGGSVAVATGLCAGEGVVAVGSVGTLAAPMGVACAAGQTAIAGGGIATGAVLMKSGVDDIREGSSDSPEPSSGASRPGKAPEIDGKPLSESQVPDKMEKFLGEGYREVEAGKGRYLSEDGLRQVRYGDHEVKEGGRHHVHFEFYDKPVQEGGRVIKNISVEVLP